METSNEKKCELCEEKATNICFDCSFYLCDSCFTFIHEKGSKAGHKKEDIKYYFSVELKFSIHPKIPLSLFCVEEKSKIKIYNNCI